MLGKFRWLLAAGVMLAAQAMAAEPPAPADPAAGAPTAEMEKQFSLDLTNATLSGHFTVDGRNDAPREEKYTITSVKKLVGDLWLFNAQIQYGDKNMKVPLPLPVKWAGDTPVITVTDVTVPGMGTYTARVLIYKDRYAGTWSAGDHGGQLYGRIERSAADPAAQTDPAPEKPPVEKP